MSHTSDARRAYLNGFEDGAQGIGLHPNHDWDALVRRSYRAGFTDGKRARAEARRVARYVVEGLRREP